MALIAMRREHELHGRRRSRNWGVLAALLGLVLLLFAVTIVKLGPGAANPSADRSWGESLVLWLRGEPVEAPEPPAVEPAQPVEPER